MSAAPTPALPRFPLGWKPQGLRGCKVVLVGLGSFGGGIGAARWLLRQGARLTITDLRDEASFTGLADELRSAGAKLVLGRHDLADLEGATCVVASPAVPSGSTYLQAAAARAIPVETEISLLARMLPCPWVGVTGTNGKSTTAALITRALKTAFPRVHAGGNMGGSLLDRVEEIEPGDRVVLELSSFQLEHLAPTGLGPPLAVLTSLSPDHLDRHGSFEHYAGAKRSILRCAEVAVIPFREGPFLEWGRAFAGEVRWVGDRDPECRPAWFLDRDSWVQAEANGEMVRVTTSSPALMGGHNRTNILTAAAAATAFGAGFEESIRAGLETPALRSRLEPIAEHEGVRFVDDGVSTSPEAVVAALRSIDAPIHLLMGGYDKGLDPAELVEEIRRRGVRTHLFGAVAEKMERRLRRAPRQSDAGATRHDTLDSAFAAAVREVRPGEVVLLSPGFASYDQFRNFEERVQRYRELVSAHRRGAVDRIPNRSSLSHHAPMNPSEVGEP